MTFDEAGKVLGALLPPEWRHRGWAFANLTISDDRDRSPNLVWSVELRQPTPYVQWMHFAGNHPSAPTVTYDYTTSTLEAGDPEALIAQAKNVLEQVIGLR